MSDNKNDLNKDTYLENISNNTDIYKQNYDNYQVNNSSDSVGDTFNFDLKNTESFQNSNYSNPNFSNINPSVPINPIDVKIVDNLQNKEQIFSIGDEQNLDTFNYDLLDKEQNKEVNQNIQNYSSQSNYDINTDYANISQEINQVLKIEPNIEAKTEKNLLNLPNTPNNNYIKNKIFHHSLDSFRFQNQINNTQHNNEILKINSDDKINTPNGTQNINPNQSSPNLKEKINIFGKFQISKKILIIDFSIILVLVVLVFVSFFLQNNYLNSVSTISQVQYSNYLEYFSYNDDYSFINQNLSKLTEKIQTQQSKLENINEYNAVVDPKTYRNFTGEQFKKLTDDFDYSKVTKNDKVFEITGNSEVDKYIIQLAEKKGYKKRNLAIESNLEIIDGQRVQTEVKNAWLNLKNLASKDGLNLVLVSGYRSPEEQKKIFLNDLGKEYTDSEILAGKADQKINKILETRSIPGYSKHHTGYAIDVGCNSLELLPFKDSNCYKWISNYNYLAAKSSSFVPSYPEGAQNQGPVPEAWEYIWIDSTLLKV